MKMHSVIHNQLSAPVYRPMLQYSWQSAGYVNPEQVSDFKNVIQVAFDFSALECGSEDCSGVASACCAYCSAPCCFMHFIENPHVHF